MKLNGLEKNFSKGYNNEIFDFEQIGHDSLSPLMYAFLYNKSENFNLSKDQWDYLIKNSDLKQIDENGWSPLMLALSYKNEENLNLSSEQWKYLIDNSDLSLIKEKEELIILKKICAELINDEILHKIDIKQEVNKKVKL